ncbi:MAG: DUF5060 domain-containing protein [Candidatus Sumerlaeota bacterium]|nr:DUF5060 domain-containing protein [Candidatus Sumerlaeota bacterium]
MQQRGGGLVPLVSLNKTGGGWRPDTFANISREGIGEKSAVERITTSGTNLSPELAVRAAAGEAFGILLDVSSERKALGKGRNISASIFLPEDSEIVCVQLIASHEIWGWYQTAATRMLTAGKWNLVSWRLEADSGEWRPAEGLCEWNDVMRWRLDCLGLRFYPSQDAAASENEPYGSPDASSASSESGAPVSAARAPIRIRDLGIEGAEDPLPPLNFIRFAPQGQPQTRVGERFELTFDLTRGYDNPFDPDVVSVDVDFMTPDGTTITLPAFYDQDYERGRLDDGTETYVPRGRASWKARYMPLKPGTHNYCARATDHTGASCQTPVRELQVAAGLKPFHGFIRVDRTDPRYFTFDDGSLYYPISIIVRSPSEKRWKYNYDFDQMPDEFALAAYDDYFTSMGQAGINHTRVWMGAWWTALEWSRGFSPDYQGLGRYNLLNAWRMDHVVDLAAKEGLYINLCFQNHGQFSLSVDNEWAENPYNIERGGMLKRPEDFFPSSEARRYFVKRLRYIVARWSYSPAIAMWELFNEVNLTNAYRTEPIQNWHRDMARKLRALDPYQHIITTHYTKDRYDPAIMGLPEIEVAQSNCYFPNMAPSLRDLFSKYGSHNKPALINEFGVGMTHPELRYNLHAGLWGSVTTPYGGVARWWWWTYTYEKNEYLQFQALMEFLRGEDPRGRKYQMIWMNASDRYPSAAMSGMRNDRSARLWIYDRRIYEVTRMRWRPVTPVARTMEPVTVTVEGLTPGRYRIEFWDTWLGKPVAHKEEDLKEGALSIQTPVFARDVACKIDKL